MTGEPVPSCHSTFSSKLSFFWGTLSLKEETDTGILPEMEGAFMVTQPNPPHFTDEETRLQEPWHCLPEVACPVHSREGQAPCGHALSPGPRISQLAGRAHTNPGSAPLCCSPPSSQNTFLQGATNSRLLPKSRHWAILPLGKVSNSP